MGKQLDRMTAYIGTGRRTEQFAGAVAAVEREFNFEFLDSDLGTSSFRNLESLAKVVAERRASA